MDLPLQVGVKILLQNTEKKYLLLRRNAEKYPETGAKWDIPGGRIDPGTALLENLKREVMEETGLELVGEPTLISAQDILKPDKHVVRLTYVGQAAGIVKLSEEHSEYQWFTKTEIECLEPLDSYIRKILPLF